MLITISSARFCVQKRKRPLRKRRRVHHHEFAVHHIGDFDDLDLREVPHCPFQIPNSRAPFIRADPELNPCMERRRCLRDGVVIGRPKDIPERLVAVTSVKMTVINISSPSIQVALAFTNSYL